jgi:hypothetical protein
MRSLLYMCIGLIGISSLAGCGLVSRWKSDCDCDTCRRPVPRMMVRRDMQTNTIIVDQAPSSSPTNQKIEAIPMPTKQPEADRLPKIPTLPVSPVSDMSTAEPAPLKVEALPPGAEDFVEPRSDKSIVTVQGAPQKRDDSPSVKTNEIVETIPTPRESSGNAPGEKTIALKSVHIQYGHSDDFKSVTGQAQMWRKTIRLRYAPVDQEDPYGGYVILEGGADLSKLRDGQHIHIRGVLLQPEEPNGSAHFRVQSFEILD